MSNDSQEEKKSRKFSLQNFKMDRKFLIIAFVLIISIVSVIFATRDLFDTNVDDWTITRGAFEGDEGSLRAITPEFNWAFHPSNVSYGEWEWTTRYFGSGSASIIFIGIDQNSDFNLHSQYGYKLEIDVSKNLNLKRLDGLLIETVIASSSFTFEAATTYRFKVLRTLDGNFTIYLNDIKQFSVIDNTYDESDVFELDWYNRHTIAAIEARDSVGDSTWVEYFTGMPLANSTNIFTQIAIYIPFVVLAAVILFYLVRLLFSEGSWTRFIVPLLFAIIIGVGFGLLFDYLRELIPELNIDTNNPSFSPSGENGTTPFITPTNSSSGNNGGGNGGGGGQGNAPLSKEPISIILLVISGLFILMMIGFVMIDFFRKREDEFHEKIVQKDIRWIPKADEADHRKRIIRAYHKTSYDLIDHGAKSDKSMTPGDFERQAKERIELSDDSLDEITDLYEEARFSEHELSSDKSEKAEKMHSNISNELKKKNIEQKEQQEHADLKKEENEQKKKTDDGEENSS